ncbi:MAG: selenide, water dikinase SelD [Actinobacteria bacterium]|nr:selenide, water dikinase SelD [Actinomycetota bacterium]MBS1884298.1 selenide, water dikinase SelD [Actinomycetota bacterium]
MRLTSLSHGAGCACKIDAAQLRAIRAAIPAGGHDPALLVGLDPADDAAVYRLSDELALVQTIDFFTPIVDDPRDFGRIAATNALSDVYAMGARPVLALNVVAFSLDDLGTDILTEILSGGAEVAAAAGVPIAGGHSIDDPEPKYGMAVSGVVNPDEVLTAAGGRAGDDLYLTKPVGGGLITTASKRGIAKPDWVAAAVATMTTLNAEAAAAARAAGAHALTDVTGFGLLGHLHELCEASGLAAELDADAVPALPGTLELAAGGEALAGGSARNAADAEAFTTFVGDIPAERRVLLADAMTSGGLLAAVPPGAAMEGTRIGVLVEGDAGSISVI